MNSVLLWITVIILVQAAFALFFVFPYFTFGPWVAYYVDTERIPNDNETAEFLRQYPMLKFERQQYADQLCFPTMDKKRWTTEFGLDEKISCDDYGCTTYYCLSEWSGPTPYKKISVSMGHLQPLLWADAFWYFWWWPFVLIVGAAVNSGKTLIGIVFVIFAFGIRGALFTAEMTEFFKYDGMSSDPLHGGYVQNSTLLQQFTTRSYAYGFVLECIVIGANGLAMLIIVVVVLVIGLAEECPRVNSFGDKLKRCARSSRPKSTCGCCRTSSGGLCVKASNAEGEQSRTEGAAADNRPQTSASTSVVFVVSALTVADTGSTSMTGAFDSLPAYDDIDFARL